MKKTALIAAAAALFAAAGTATADQFITGDQVLDGSITAEDLDPDVMDPTYVRRTLTFPKRPISEDEEILPVTTIVRCPSGTRAVNGGIRSMSDGSDLEWQYVISSYPGKGGWVMKFHNPVNGTSDIVASLYAVCV